MRVATRGEKVTIRIRRAGTPASSSARACAMIRDVLPLPRAPAMRTAREPGEIGGSCTGWLILSQHWSVVYVVAPHYRDLRVEICAKTHRCSGGMTRSVPRRPVARAARSSPWLRTALLLDVLLNGGASHHACRSAEVAARPQAGHLAQIRKLLAQVVRRVALEAEHNLVRGQRGRRSNEEVHVV